MSERPPLPGETMQPGVATPMLPAGATLGEVLFVVARQLREAGIAHAANEARRLVATATGIAALTVATEPGQRLTPDAIAAVADATRRRAAREPLARIAGWREFHGRSFALSPATLEPRADTETLVEAALDVVRAEGWLDRPLRILDIGTGTGCVLLTLLAELPRATGLATDISVDALDMARANAERLGVASRARFAEARSLDGVAGPFDLVVSNPPYIPTAHIATLDAEVREHDPLAALDGGPDGLSIYREIASRLPEVCPAGWTLVEVGAGQSEDVHGILRAASWPIAVAPQTRAWVDLGGHTRVVAIGTHCRKLCE